ncbi:hypothetical protein CPC735_012150 [Coccidioides posadasii C735 delta SOWgp]|nr:hypothetical protein CPC735_012150 [Coccidioides posadasii C735 delta SOWgp]EER29897.1 hypothetical protein CPC735_012150 [Coccidioides posadasii C735 delta SOWgp]|eukprot:XP_003072042.1 hypothetical protein CPC735_012150 [Coccidioides posadasii C735 delta SOWgp]
MLMDAQVVRDRMTMMLKAVHRGGLDPDAGKARQDQLVLPEDPTFVPRLMLPGLNLDLSALEIADVLETPRKTSDFLSSCLDQSNKSSLYFQKQHQLDLSSSQAGPSVIGGFGLPSEMDSASKGPQVELPAYLGAEEGVLLEPGFEFDVEGNIIELPVKGDADHVVVDDIEEHNFDVEMAGANQEGFQFEDLPINEDMRDLQDREATLPLAESPSNRPWRIGFEPSTANEDRLSQQETRVSLKKRRFRNMEVDDYPELMNSDLAQWNFEYAQNMEAAGKVKETNKLVTIAKKNAAFCVLEAGIAAVGLGLGMSQVPHPLDTFCGSRLLSALTGTEIEGTRRKRNHNAASDSDSDDFERNVRHKVGGEPSREASVERGVVQFDDIEMGRHAPPALQDDMSSQMPWNITASVHSSHRGSSVAVGHSGISGMNSTFRSGKDSLVPHSASGRRGRLTSASPLAGRGVMRNVLHGLSLQDEDLDMNVFADINMESFAGDAHGGPISRMSTPAAARDRPAEPEWFLSNLDQQSLNFLEYVKVRIGNTSGGASDGDCEDGEVSFSTLVPAGSSSRIVATQGLLHVLMLATNRVLRVRQEVVAFARGCDDAGEIFLSLDG